MKPAKFAYFAPDSLAAALELLRQYGGDAKPLAGGQSLMPLLNMRLVRPSVIIDLNRLAALDYLVRPPDGGLAVGALTRQRTLEKSPDAAAAAPLLAAGLGHTGHWQIRNRGTLGGSLAHADPAAELPALAVALDATLTLRSAAGERTLPAADFFIANLITALEPDELLTEVRFGEFGGDWRWGFYEVCRRAGDFALAGAIAQVQLETPPDAAPGTAATAHSAAPGMADADPAPLCRAARLTLFGVGPVPQRIPAAERWLAGRRLDADALRQAAALVEAALEPDSDIHAPAQYRREVGAVAARRALEAALRPPAPAATAPSAGNRPPAGGI